MEGVGRLRGEGEGGGGQGKEGTYRGGVGGRGRGKEEGPSDPTPPSGEGAWHTSRCLI